MPRAPRQKSMSGIYHVIMRGNDDKTIFCDYEDNIKFKEILERYKVKIHFMLYAYCLLENHVHLLIKEGIEDLSSTVKRLTLSYARYYNRKYNTTGSLFQGRFKSESVEDWNFLLTTVRFIHQNPLKLRLINFPQLWQWSSCVEYYNIQHHFGRLTDCEEVLKRFSNNKEEAVAKFKEYNEIIVSQNCMDYEKVRKLTDEEAELQIQKTIPGVNVKEIMYLPKNDRNKIIRRLKGIKGVTQRQIAKISGMSQTLISNA